MKIVPIISSLALFSLLFSCSGKPTNKSVNTVTIQEQQATEADLPSLNQGERWMVNAEMKPFIQTGRELVETYIKSSDTGFLQLAAQLKTQDDQLIASCTMSGQSHDELHKWLHPHLNLVKQLSDATSSPVAQPIILALQQSYRDFDVYFQ
jgi:hypothetical protein